jgi:hypothetical protein
MSEIMCVDVLASNTPMMPLVLMSVKGESKSLAGSDDSFDTQKVDDSINEFDLL